LAWDKCAGEIDTDALVGMDCYGGLDLSSTIDFTAFGLVFPSNGDEKFRILPFFWIPETILKDRKMGNVIETWVRQGFVKTTPGNVVDYGIVLADIAELRKKFHMREIAFDRWGATKVIQDLQEMDVEVVQFGQGYASMSMPTKELMGLVLSERLDHGGNPVLRWMADNIVVKQDAAGNIKPDKEKSTEKIDGIVATIMALDRAMRHERHESIYSDEGERPRGIMVIGDDEDEEWPEDWDKGEEPEDE